MADREVSNTSRRGTRQATLYKFVPKRTRMKEFKRSSPSHPVGSQSLVRAAPR